MKYTKIFLSLSFVTIIPTVSFAAFEGVNDLLISFGRLVNAAIPIAFALGLLFFFWGMAQFILASGNPAALEKGRNFMIYGVIALFVMASVWGLVRFLGDTLGISTPGSTNSLGGNPSTDPCDGLGDGCN